MVENQSGSILKLSIRNHAYLKSKNKIKTVVQYD